MTNPFAIFDLPVAFNVDQALLSERYLVLQKSLHPDNFVTADAQEQRIAMQKSTEVNDALKTLKDPILRAEAIIALNTGETQDLEQKSTQDMTFLMQQLEWREELENIEQSQDENALESFAKRVKKETKEMLTALEEQLNKQQWSTAAQLCDKLRFLKKLADEISQVEERLFEL